MLSKLVDTTFISFKESEKYFKNKVIYSGNPCGEKALKIEKHDKTKLGFDINKKLILIVMGSLGSEVINTKLSSFLEEFDSKTEEILFITGKSSYSKFKDLKVKKMVKIVPFYENLSGIMKASDLVISRAGASTISEIIMTNTPSILIPSPYVANNHQYYNALDLSEKKEAIMLEQDKLTTETLKEKIKEALNKEKEIRELLSKEPKLLSSSIIVEEMKK